MVQVPTCLYGAKMTFYKYLCMCRVLRSLCLSGNNKSNLICSLTTDNEHQILNQLTQRYHFLQDIIREVLFTDSHLLLNGLVVRTYFLGGHIKHCYIWPQTSCHQEDEEHTDQHIFMLYLIYHTSLILSIMLTCTHIKT